MQGMVPKSLHTNCLIHKPVPLSHKLLSKHVSLQQMDKLLFGMSPGIMLVAYIFGDCFNKVLQTLLLKINKENFQECMAGVILFP